MNIILATKQKHFADAFRIRTNVFVGEQAVPVHEEIDDLDCFVPIFVAYENEVAKGTARVILKNDDVAKIGRVAVTKEFRGDGVGRELMLEVIQYVIENTNVSEIQLDAQLTAVKFYETLGFTSYGEIFKDAGIDHILMKYVIQR
ncbi:MAG: GNAT family N-acetyltransferase [Turicibacter sp.]|nr:GNAT family N-acetyltransferase [Turicibacter sp.]